MNKKAIFFNTASQVAVRFITLAFTLISIKLLSNYLGATGLGNFNTITTYINLFIVVADLGLFSVAVREIAKNPDNEKKILANSFFIRLVSALIACVVASGIVFLTKYNPEIKFGVLIASGYLFFNLLASVYDVLLQYRLKMQYSALAEFIAKPINILLIFIIIRLHGNFFWITSTIAIWGISIFLLKWLFSIRFVKVGVEYDRKTTRWILSLSLPLGLVFIVNNLFFKLDTLMLFAIKGAAAVGIYSVAYRVLETTTFIAGYFASALKPSFSKEVNDDKKALGRIVEKSIMVMLLCAIPITVISIAFSKEIILFLSNSDFLSGANALVILALSLPFIYLIILLSEILIANDSRKTFLGISIFILLFNFATNLYAITRFSFMGASVTTLISEVLLFGIMVFFAKKIVPFTLKNSKIFVITILFLLTLLAAHLFKSVFHLYFIWNVIITVLAYATIGYLLGLVKPRQAVELINTRTSR